MSADRRFFIYDMAAGHEHWCSQALVPFIKAAGYSMAGCTGPLSSAYIQAQADRSSFCLMWNGYVGSCLGLASAFAQQGKPVCIVEAAWFPQRGFYFLDRKGIVGRHSLVVDDLSWVTDEHMQALSTFRAQYMPEYTKRSDSYTLVLLQLESDVAIRQYSPWKTMQAFVDYVRDMYPKERLVIRQHPKETRGTLRIPKGAKLAAPCPLHIALGDAKQVVAINSTALFEAALKQVPVRAFGCCSLQQHAAQPDKLLAAMVDMQVPVRQPDPTYWLRRYGGLGDFFPDTAA